MIKFVVQHHLLRRSDKRIVFDNCCHLFLLPVQQMPVHRNVDLLRAMTYFCKLLVVDRFNDFLNKARVFFKTISKIDLTLISIYQGYIQNRSFISFNKLKYFYPTKTSISLLNNLHFKLVENKVFIFHPEFSYKEILFSLIQFFKISHSNHLTIKKYIHIFQSTLQHSTNIHIVASVCYFLISNQTINLNLNINEILLFFGVRKSTIMNKIRIIKKSAIL